MSKQGLLLIDSATGIKLRRCATGSSNHEDFEFVDNECVDAVSYLADAQFILQEMCNAVGASHAATSLQTSVIGYIGLTDEPEQVCDKELAEHLNCDYKTIYRWRKAYKEDKATCRFLEIIEGEHNKKERRTEAASYRISPDAKEAINRAVQKGRSNPLYSTDRKQALRDAAVDEVLFVPGAKYSNRTNRTAMPAPTAETFLRRAANNITEAANDIENLNEASLEERQDEIRKYREQIAEELKRIDQALSKVSQPAPDARKNVEKEEETFDFDKELEAVRDTPLVQNVPDPPGAKCPRPPSERAAWFREGYIEAATESPKNLRKPDSTGKLPETETTAQLDFEGETGVDADIGVIL